MPFRLPTPVLLFLIGLVFVILCGLGVWQVERGIWKANLVATRNAQLAGQPLSAADARTMSPDSLEYHAVSLEGTWDADHVMILANRARYGRKGENIVQPLIIAPGEAVLVDRGWYPSGEREAALKRLASTTGPTHGLARYAEGLSASKTGAGTWTGIAPDAMGVGLPYRLLPWFVTEGQLDEGGDYASMPTAFPVQGYQRYVSNVSHTEYALAWFGIAATLAGVSIFRFVIEPRRARRVEEAARAAEPQHRA